MVKLTVIYNLPEGADHEEFIKWRTTTHQEANAKMPHVLKTDFYVAKETMLGKPAYRYITEAYYETMEDLENSFFTPEAQAKLKEDSKKGSEMIFLISDEIVTTVNKK
jgi:predicted DNA-binding protein